MPVNRNWLSELSKHRLIPLLLVVGFYTIYQLPLLSGLAGLGGDGLLYFYPAEHQMAEALHNGTLPFWSTRVQAGFPLLADGQPGALYPVNLVLFGLLPTPIAHNLVYFLHGLLGLIFCYLWARTIKLSEEAAAGVAFIFVFTSPLLGENVPYLETLTWTPCLFWLSEKLVQQSRFSVKYITVISLAVACQWLAGFPQIALYSIVTVAVYIFGRLFMTPASNQQRLKFLVWWGTAVVIGLTWAAPQLLSTLELTEWSIRDAGISGSMAGEGSLFPATLITLLFPGWKSLLNSMGLGVGFYVGIIPLTLILLTFLHYKSFKNPYLLPLVGASFAALFFAFGRFNPAFALIRELPGFSFFRVPSRFLNLAQLCLLTIAGIGWDALKNHSQPLSKWVYRFLVGSLLIYGLIGLITFPIMQNLEEPLLEIGERFVDKTIQGDAYHVQTDTYYADKIQNIYDQILVSINVSNQEIWLTFAVLLVGWLALRQWGNSPLTRRVWLILAIVDIWSVKGWVNSVEPAALVTQAPETLAVIEANETDEALCRIYWVVDEEGVTYKQEDLVLLPANYQAIFGLGSTGLYSPLGSLAYYELMEKLGTVNLAFGQRPVKEVDVIQQKPLLNFLNVCFLLSRQPLEDYQLITKVDDVFVYKNDAVLPRAFLVSQWHIEPNEDERLLWLWDQATQLKTTAVLNQPLPILEQATMGDPSLSSVALINYQPTTAEFLVEAVDGSLILILADSDYPGWQAKIDDVETDIFTVNGNFRGVVVPSGKHTIRFEFVPRRFYQGTAVALVGLLFLLLCWIYDHFSEKPAVSNSEEIFD